MPEDATNSVPSPIPLLAALAALAAGATLLQFCARLPPAPGVLTIVACAFVVAALAVLRAQPEAVIATAMPLRVAIAVVTCAALGFGYAAWRADRQLADALPSAWEDADLRVVGVVDDLPQNDDAGSRFAFAVERALTSGAVVPHRVSLAWPAPHPGRDTSGGTAPPARPPSGRCRCRG